MDRYSVVHIWQDKPDYESYARSMLELLLQLEADGRLSEILAVADTLAEAGESKEAA